MNILLGLFASGIVGSVIFALLLAIRPVSAKIFSKTWHYYSLIVPLVFLLGGALAASMFNFTSTDTAVAVQPQIYFAMPSVDLIVKPTIVSQFNTQQILGYITRAVPYILFIWAFGAVLFTGINIKRHLKYRHLLLNKFWFHSIIDCSIPVFISPTAHTPMLIGITKPMVIIPPMPISDQELDIILAHEMIHYRRKDLLYKLVGFIAAAIHWYNPAVYALNRQLNNLCELSCDEKVASQMDTMGRKLYGETILQVLHHSKKIAGGNLMFSTSLCNSKKNIKKRLADMMSVKKAKKHIVIFSLITTIFIAATGFIMSYLVDHALPEYVAEEQAISKEVDEFENWDEWLDLDDLILTEEPVAMNEYLNQDQSLEDIIVTTIMSSHINGTIIVATDFDMPELREDADIYIATSGCVSDAFNVIFNLIPASPEEIEYALVASNESIGPFVHGFVNISPADDEPNLFIFDFDRLE